MCIVAQSADLGTAYSPPPQFKTDTSAYRERRAKTGTSANRLSAKKQERLPLDKSEPLV